MAAKTETAPATMGTVASADGTTIAYEKVGSGPALVLVDGALCDRGFGPCRPLAAELADRFTVYLYDRRGRGDSGDTAASAPTTTPEREVEDLRAVLDRASEENGGGPVAVYGSSSGAGLALEAAAAGVPMRALVTYEAPYVAAGWKNPDVDHLAVVDGLLTEGKNGSAVGYFLVTMVGAPAFVPFMMRLMPSVWKHMRAVAPTLPNDIRIMSGFRVPADRLSRIAVKTLVLVGGKAAEPMRDAQTAVAAAVPGARSGVLDGQTHQVSAKAIAPQIAAFVSA
ncbi:alpha/beta fold hydrolase [Leifsonia poae]|uniref:Alpha/beta hydrolase n=1 Tax=Leifsonia poae TaxID=110933 RepID=A0A9W6LYZ6_9MICO|nr:alpha/beta hydrolase [Leifsonia poae]GLJ75718.1 alpha/beta hydrolase [Leifsonia poae]